MDLDNAVVILPTQSGSHPYEALAVGKRTIYLLDRTGLGHICTCCTTKNTQIVQELASVVPGTGTPVYWNGKLYFTSKSKVEMYPLNQGMLDSPTLSTWVRAEGIQLSARMGAMMEFSGILGGGVLFALDAKTLSLLYRSDQAANRRDTVPPLAHFATPMVADGKVFIGTQNSLVVYGLLP
jgi:outer membrane protein assembly factor BamB